MEREHFLNELSKAKQLKTFYSLLEHKDYDAIYNLYGKKAFSLFTPFSYKKEDIKKLMENKQYGLIYNKYGKIETFFVKDLRKLIKNDIQELQNKGDYLSINELYGENLYKKQLDKYRIEDIYNETFSHNKMVLYKTKSSVAKGLKGILKIASVVPVSTFMLLGGINIYNQNIAYQNSKIYAKELAEYNKSVEEYANYIQSLNLNDIQTIAKVMDDQWKNSDGYGDSDYDIFGLWRLDTTASDAKVKCQSLTDDFNAKMNAINPIYNARTLIVNLDTSAFGIDSFANVPRTISKNPDQNLATDKKFAMNLNFNNDLTNDNGESILFTIDETSNGYNYKNTSKTLKFKIPEDSLTIGNHKLSMIDIPNQNLSLIVDVTNLSIGTLKDGKIVMLSTLDENCVEFVPLEEIIYSPISDTINYINNSIKSYFNNYSLEDLKEMFGTKSLNEALNYVRALEDNKTK